MCEYLPNRSTTATVSSRGHVQKFPIAVPVSEVHEPTRQLEMNLVRS